ncbi:transketolase [Segnochrobactraceae bacterium EtOH-i3]
MMQTRPDLANALRFLAIDAVEKAASGHPGMPMGMADLATVLFSRHLKYDAANPTWADRDRFVLSNGHGSMLLYGLLYLTGYPGVTREELIRFRQMGSRTPGHPEFGHTAGVETTTGPLGQGLATAVGMALAERMLNAEYGDAIVDHRTWVFAGDGCLMEGISQEAISLAGRLKLNKLTVIFDDNHITIDGDTALSTVDDQLARFRASGWAVFSVDGHDQAAIDAAMTEARASDRPSLIAARTHIGFGAPKKQDTAGSHGSPLGAEEIAATRAALGWPHGPFEVPDGLLGEWRAFGRKGAEARTAWQARFDVLAPEVKAEFERRISGTLPASFAADVAGLVATAAANPAKLATRQASQKALEALNALVPELVGGSADLAGSVLSKTKIQRPLTPSDFGGRHINYGVREFGMGAAMNGIALHGGFLPYGGTFLVFSDYCRPAIRLSALMGSRVVYLMTHDSIGLGEDGPTHQPVEHLASLRAIPGLKVYRPADPVEALECWADAMMTAGPSVLVASRQGVPQVTTPELLAVTPAYRGARVVVEPAGGRDVTLIATGTEVSLAVDAAAKLAASGIKAAVVSLSCWEVFDAQDEAFRSAVLGSAPRFAVEAALPFGWTRYVASEADVFGVPTFGMSAPAGEIYAHFGLTPDAIASRVAGKIGRA